MAKYTELIRGIEDHKSKYKTPVVEDVITGFTGIDPDEKVNESDLDHEALSGLLGGSISGHYHITYEQLAQLRSFQRQIDELARTIQDVSADLSERLRILSETVGQKIQELENGQTTLEEALSAAVTEFEEINRELITRLDVIAGQTTEDTEILDARVDAELTVHPNLGHNIRNIHAVLIGLVNDFQGILRQFNSLAEAQIQSELNWQEAHERDKKALEQETQSRAEYDADLQKQVDTVSGASLDNAFNLQQEAEQRRKDIKEVNKELEYLSGENAQRADEISRVNQYAEYLDIENTARKSEIAHEAHTREERDEELRQELTDEAIEREVDLLLEEDERIRQDADLQSQVDKASTAVVENSLAIHQEAEVRRKKLSETNERIVILNSENENRKAEILSEVQERNQQDETLREALNETDKELNSEVKARVENDLGLARQINANAEAIIQTELNLLGADGRRKADLAHEESERIRQDGELQKQLDKTSAASVENSLAIHNEAEQRREDIQQEREARAGEDAVLQKEIDTASGAVIENTLNIAGEARKRRELAERLIEEVHDREREIQNLLTLIGELYEIPLPGIDEKFGILQEQADKNAQANLENSLNIRQEAEQRRKTVSGINEAISETHEAIKAEASARNEAVNQESQERVAGDKDLQTQADHASIAGIENSLAIHQEAAQRRKLEGRIEALEQEVSGIDTQSIRESVKILQSEIDTASGGIIENSLAIAEANEARRTEDLTERYARYNEDGGLQSQINTLAETCMRLSLNEYETRQKVSEIEKSASIDGTNFNDDVFNDVMSDLFNS